jgi:Cas7 group CRISPR-associated protein Csh2
MPKKKTVPINNRIEIFTLLSVTNCDPGRDAGTNMPGMFPDGRGYITDVNRKQKARSYLHQVLGENVIYQEGLVREPYFVSMNGKKGDLRTNLCADAIDNRLFGITVTGLEDSEAVHGPVQFSFMESFDVVTPIQANITCCAPAKIKKTTRKKGSEEEIKESRTGVMGSKWIIPYGLYRGYIFVSPSHAYRPRDVNSKSTAEFRGTGLTHDDLDKLFEALFYGDEHTRSASRTGLTMERVFSFEHSSLRGNGAAHKLFERIQVKRKNGVVTASKTDDYEITVDAKKLPKGVTLWEYYLDDNGDVTRKEIK